MGCLVLACFCLLGFTAWRATFNPDRYTQIYTGPEHPVQALILSCVVERIVKQSKIGMNHPIVLRNPSDIFNI